MRNIRPGDPRPGRANQVEKTSTAVDARPGEWIYPGMMIFILAIVDEDNLGHEEINLILRNHLGSILLSGASEETVRSWPFDIPEPLF